MYVTINHPIFALHMMCKIEDSILSKAVLYFHVKLLLNWYAKLIRQRYMTYSSAKDKVILSPNNWL
jgi:hypothetical protein